MESTLIARRSKRSTAGNRMAAALAEFHAEDIGMDVDEDADFALDREEEDVFESDFESTDEEGAQEDVDAAAEKLIRQEESHVRKTARTQLERITALAHARQAATFNPITIVPPTEKPKGDKKLKRRVSLGVAVNAETGEVLESGVEVIGESISTVLAGGQRHSTRKYTVASTSASVSRIRDEVLKQSSTPKRMKTHVKTPTQAELLARALDMEEGNIAEHKNYLSIEEEKRMKARVVRPSVQGPLIRWVSKKEEITVLVEPPPPLPPAPVGNPYVPYRYPPPPSPVATSPAVPAVYPYTPTRYPSALHPSQSLPIPGPPHTSPFQQWPPSPSTPSQYYQPAMGVSTTITPNSPAPHTLSPYIHVPPSTPALTVAPAPPSTPTPAPPSSRPIERKETVAKQYVVHEIEQEEKASRPTWHSTMTAMFGNHADWENLRVYTTKGRPLARPTQTCPITGKVAKYLDPRTNVPYADLEAYRVLTKVLRHEYVWSASLECYVSKEGAIFSDSGT